MLNNMYNYLPDNSPVRIFIQNNCSHLLQAPLEEQGGRKNTTYSVDYFQVKNFISHNILISLPINYSNNTLGQYSNRAGVYTIFCTKTNQFYIGATTNFSVRLMNHYHGVDSNSNHLLYQEVKKLGGFQNFLWEATSVSPNYYIEFIRNNMELSKDYLTYRILTSYTQYETRLLEQSLKS